jgi:hypothetical protein
MSLTDQLRAKATELEKIASSLRAAADGLENVASYAEDRHLGSGILSDSLLGRSPDSLLPPPAPSARLPIAPSKDYSLLSGVDLIASILREAQGPVGLEQISAKLKEYGRLLGNNTVQSYLSRDKRFRNVGRGVWELRPSDTPTLELKEEQ